MSMTFGKMIKQRRIEKGLSQQKLADMTYTSRNGIMNWENVGCLPNLEYAVRLCKALGITPEEVFELFHISNNTGEIES